MDIPLGDAIEQEEGGECGRKKGGSVGEKVEGRRKGANIN